jgi:TetR/AcrR family transcriptional repressor of nem operon
MRRSKEDAAATRAKIVEAAAKLFRARGLAAVSVADVMAECGLTVGGFYRHFDSKESLAAEAIELASVHSTAAELTAEQLVRSYVSLEHVQHPEAGCPVAALCSEIHREHGEPRKAFDGALERMIAHIPTGRAEALTMAATAVGAIVLARAATDQAQAKEIIEAARDELLRQVRRRPS